jgi:two-component system, LytTR family, sensor histidine kinase AlgZ
MARMKRRWALAFCWINLAVLVVALIEVATNQMSTRDLLQMLAYALVCANLSGVLGVWIITDIAGRLAVRKFPILPVVVSGIILVSAVGCLIAQALFVEIGFPMPQHFWQGYLDTLRIALPLAALFGMGALAYSSLRRRAQLAEQRLHEKEMAEERSRKLAAEARLRSLESRIHPHFLFNTLNSISSLIAVNPERAEQTVGRLASLLRASLETSQQRLIPLREELKMVESYVDIEKVRFGEKLRASVEVPAQLQDAKVPPMSVQSLVENAVKHGITPLSGGGDFLVAASADNGNLRIEVSDTGAGFDLASIPAGHGLDSLVERLDSLFGERARLNVFRRNNYSVVEMILPRV